MQQPLDPDIVLLLDRDDASDIESDLDIDIDHERGSRGPQIEVKEVLNDPIEIGPST